METQVQLDPQDHKGLKVREEKVACQARQAQLERGVPQVPLDQQDLVAHKDRKD